jgi:hypothetical protein
MTSQQVHRGTLMGLRGSVFRRSFVRRQPHRAPRQCADLLRSLKPTVAPIDFRHFQWGGFHTGTLLHC